MLKPAADAAFDEARGQRAGGVRRVDGDAERTVGGLQRLAEHQPGRIDHILLHRFLQAEQRTPVELPGQKLVGAYHRGEMIEAQRVRAGIGGSGHERIGPHRVHRIHADQIDEATTDAAYRGHGQITGGGRFVEQPQAERGGTRGDGGAVRHCQPERADRSAVQPAVAGGEAPILGIDDQIDLPALPARHRQLAVRACPDEAHRGEA